ncbi:methionine synthase, partial [bacterium]|nr:methionine synthase [bacterium]
NILKDEVVGEEATRLFADAKKLLHTIVEENWLTANGVIGIWPANTSGDDIEIYTDDSRKEVLDVVHTLRQQTKKAKGAHNMALSDFIAPKETGIADYFGGFAVTTGIGIDEHVARFEADHDDYNSIMLKALADRLAEAFAELMHEKVRKELWGYGSTEKLSKEDLIKESYKGIRPAPGYPACPDHTEKWTLFKLLDAEKNTEIKLTESLAMIPTAAVSGFYFGHPQSKYFGLGKIQKDQIKDYAQRKKMSLDKAEKWLSPILIYR